MNTDEANQLLPQNPTKIITDPLRLNYLIVALPKWGKTTFACSAPQSLLLAFEQGHAFTEIHKIIIDSWDRPYSEKKNGPGEDEDKNLHMSLAEAVEAIVASSRFQFIIVDTADMAAKMCLDYHYKKYGVIHATDAGDYGRGWDVCLVQPFRQAFGALMKSGRGIAFITHTQIVNQKVGSQTISRAETTLPSQVQKFLHTQADVIIHGGFGKKLPGMNERDRVITLDGSNEILAGSRVRAIRLPKRFIVSEDNPWAQWTSFFKEPKAVLVAESEYEKVYGKTQAGSVLATEPETISEPPATANTEANGGQKKTKKTN